MSVEIVSANKTAVQLSESAVRELASGKLTARDVLERARDPDSALHRYFEWDDSEAAEKFRLIQAHGLIKRARVTIVQASGETAKVRAFVSLASDRVTGGGYRSTERVLASEVLTAGMLATAKLELAAFRRKYGQLTQLAGVLDAIERMEVAELIEQ